MWNYRILKRQVGTEFVYKIVEVYYDDEGLVKGYTDGIAPSGANVNELAKDLLYMASAFSMPVLDEAVLQRELKKKSI